MTRINKFTVLIVVDAFMAISILTIVVLSSRSEIAIQNNVSRNSTSGVVLGDFSSCDMTTTYLSHSNCTSNFGDWFPVEEDYMGCGNLAGDFCPSDSDTADNTDGIPSAPPDSYIRTDCDARNYVEAANCTTRTGARIRANGEYSIDNFSFNSTTDDYVLTLSSRTATSLASVDLELEVFYGDNTMSSTCQNIPSVDPGYGGFETVSINIPVDTTVDLHLPSSITIPDSYFENGCVGIRTDIVGYNFLKENCRGGWGVPGTSFSSGPAVVSSVSCTYATTPTPSPTDTPIPTATLTPTPSATPVISPSVTPTQAFSPTVTPSAMPTISTTVTPSISITVTPLPYTPTPTPLVGSVLPDSGVTTYTLAIYFSAFTLILLGAVLII